MYIYLYNKIARNANGIIFTNNDYSKPLIIIFIRHNKTLGSGDMTPYSRDYLLAVYLFRSTGQHEEQLNCFEMKYQTI